MILFKQIDGQVNLWRRWVWQNRSRYRASFVVASSGKQVAIVAPTTILVEQHLKL